MGQAFELLLFKQPLLLLWTNLSEKELGRVN